mgnify:CR=1 FL=1
MDNVLQKIARENFRSAGYLRHPSRERRTHWTFTTPPTTRAFTHDTVRAILRRRREAADRPETTSKRSVFHALLHR